MSLSKKTISFLDSKASVQIVGGTEVYGSCFDTCGCGTDPRSMTQHVHVKRQSAALVVLVTVVVVMTLILAQPLTPGLAIIVQVIRHTEWERVDSAHHRIILVQELIVKCRS